MSTTLRLSGKMHSVLKDHLHPTDGKEAVAILLCSRFHHGNVTSLLVRHVHPIPYDQCEVRRRDMVTWSTASIQPLLKKAMNSSLAVVKVHSHPGGLREFSTTDDLSDIHLFESVFGWTQDQGVHASLVMLPDGELFGRVIMPDLSFESLQRIQLVGDDICFWGSDGSKINDEFNLRTVQTLGLGTTSRLRQLTVAVVGCSGTGSPTIMQLARLGVGHLVLVDPDVVEEKNLSRIYGSRMDDVLNRRSKVEVLRDEINSIGLGTKVTIVPRNLRVDKELVELIGGCDVVFGCVDSIDGRHVLNSLATFYLVPYFDMGVKIIADGKGGIDQICGTVHYLQPGGSSLRSRGVYNHHTLTAVWLHNTDPEEYEVQRKSGYIVNVVVESPAVITLNTKVSAMAVEEFLARIHPMRKESNAEYAIWRFSTTDGYYQHEEEGEPDPYLERYVGRGTMEPLLDMNDFQ